MIMGLKRAQGSEEIRKIREGLWNGPVKTRKHSLEKIFPFGAGSLEVMVFGSVEYGLRNGREVGVEWAGRAVFEEVDGKELKMRFYQVYLVSFVFFLPSLLALVGC
jgi:hypothetical protein